jgi:hypothetical protein
MMPNDRKTFSFKRIQIDKATTTMVILISAAVAVFIFALFASKALLSQRSYNAKVINQKEKAKKQLEANIEARDTLVAAYQGFIGSPQNVIGGDPNGLGEDDGDNARMILDALPSKYDFPALATSIEKLVISKSSGLSLESMSGTDEEITQNQTALDSPSPVEMPFQLSLMGSYASVQGFSKVLEQSIRPFHIRTLSLSGTDSTMKLDLTAKTYYQPEKKVNIKQVEVK